MAIQVVGKTGWLALLQTVCPSVGPSLQVLWRWRPVQVLLFILRAASPVALPIFHPEHTYVYLYHHGSFQLGTVHIVLSCRDSGWVVKGFIGTASYHHVDLMCIDG